MGAYSAADYAIEPEEAGHIYSCRSAEMSIGIVTAKTGSITVRYISSAVLPAEAANTGIAEDRGREPYVKSMVSLLENSSENSIKAYMRRYIKWT